MQFLEKRSHPSKGLRASSSVDKTFQSLKSKHTNHTENRKFYLVLANIQAKGDSREGACTSKGTNHLILQYQDDRGVKGHFIVTSSDESFYCKCVDAFYSISKVCRV